MRRASGYSLLELVLALGVMALASLVVIPMLAQGDRDGDVRTVRSAILELVEGARIEAVRSGRPVAVTFHPQTRDVIAGERVYTLPGDWRVEIGRREEGPAGRELRFEPVTTRRMDGSPVERIELMTWTSRGLSSATAWATTGASGGRVVVTGDAIDGVRVR